MAQKYALQTSFTVTILLLLVLGPHFENHWYSETQRAHEAVAVDNLEQHGR